jgi:hypothetical protein
VIPGITLAEKIEYFKGKAGEMRSIAGTDFGDAE